MHFIVRFIELIMSEIQSGWASTCITAFFLYPTGLEAADEQSQSLQLALIVIVIAIHPTLITKSFIFGSLLL